MDEISRNCEELGATTNLLPQELTSHASRDIVSNVLSPAVVGSAERAGQEQEENIARIGQGGQEP